jgi:hypothetical protein
MRTAGDIKAPLAAQTGGAIGVQPRERCLGREMSLSGFYGRPPESAGGC